MSGLRLTACVARLLGLAAACVLQSGYAAEAPSSDAATAPAPAVVAPTATPALGFAGRARVTDLDLARRRGKGAPAEASLTASVSDNQASHVVTGGNQITAGAFAGASGIPVVIQNSGNNVLIQNSVVVNVQLK